MSVQLENRFARSLSVCAFSEPPNTASYPDLFQLLGAHDVTVDTVFIDLKCHGDRLRKALQLGYGVAIGFNNSEEKYSEDDNLVQFKDEASLHSLLVLLQHKNIRAVHIYSDARLKTDRSEESLRETPQITLFKLRDALDKSISMKALFLTLPKDNADLFFPALEKVTVKDYNWVAHPPVVENMHSMSQSQTVIACILCFELATQPPAYNEFWTKPLAEDEEVGPSDLLCWRALWDPAAEKSLYDAAESCFVGIDTTKDVAALIGNRVMGEKVNVRLIKTTGISADTWTRQQIYTHRLRRFLCARPQHREFLLQCAKLTTFNPVYETIGELYVRHETKAWKWKTKLSGEHRSHITDLCSAYFRDAKEVGRLISATEDCVKSMVELFGTKTLEVTAMSAALLPAYQATHSGQDPQNVEPVPALYVSLRSTNSVKSFITVYKKKEDQTTLMVHSLCTEQVAIPGTAPVPKPTNPLVSLLFPQFETFARENNATRLELDSLDYVVFNRDTFKKQCNGKHGEKFYAEDQLVKVSYLSKVEQREFNPKFRLPAWYERTLGFTPVLRDVDDQDTAYHRYQFGDNQLTLEKALHAPQAFA